MWHVGTISFSQHIVKKVKIPTSQRQRAQRGEIRRVDAEERVDARVAPRVGVVEAAVPPPWRERLGGGVVTPKRSLPSAEAPDREKSAAMGW